MEVVRVMQKWQGRMQEALVDIEQKVTVASIHKLVTDNMGDFMQLTSIEKELCQSGVLFEFEKVGLGQNHALYIN